MTAFGTVLVVEDEKSIASLLHLALRRAGFEVLSAATAAQAGQLAAGADLRLAIIDVSLPDGSGAELAKRLQSAAPQLPVILTSGLPLSNPERDGVWFLQKPFAPRQMLELASRILG